MKLLTSTKCQCQGHTFAKYWHGWTEATDSVINGLGWGCRCHGWTVHWQTVPFCQSQEQTTSLSLEVPVQDSVVVGTDCHCILKSLLSLSVVWLASVSLLSTSGRTGLLVGGGQRSRAGDSVCHGLCESEEWRGCWAVRQEEMVGLRLRHLSIIWEDSRRFLHAGDWVHLSCGEISVKPLTGCSEPVLRLRTLWGFLWLHDLLTDLPASSLQKHVDVSLWSQENERAKNDG